MPIYFVQYGVPNAEPRMFLDSRLHPLAKQVGEPIVAKDWKEAREKVGILPPAPDEDE